MTTIIGASEEVQQERYDQAKALQVGLVRNKIDSWVDSENSLHVGPIECRWTRNDGGYFYMVVGTGTQLSKRFTLEAAIMFLVFMNE